MARPHPALLRMARGLDPGPVHDQAGLLASAVEHRCEGLLWSWMEQGRIALDASTARSLAAEGLRVRAKHRLLSRSLQQVVAASNHQGVRLIMAKGLAAQQRWYDRDGERPTNDLDMLAAAEDRMRLPALVDELEPGHVYGRHLPALIANDGVQAIDVRLPDGFELDLHLDLLKIEVPLRQRELFSQRAVPVELPDVGSVLAVDAELSLVHFLVHLNKDRFSRLLGFVDVARILQREQLDWAVIERFVRGEGLGVVVERSLRTVADVMDVEPPSSIDLGSGGWRTVAWDRLWPSGLHLRGEEGMASHTRRQYWIPWLSRGRAREALRWFVRRRVFLPDVYVRCFYPHVRGPYLWRLLRGRIDKALNPELYISEG